ncbi:MAG: hypothetical protein COX79_04030 [Candidatus Levybacteria bacterium CG_4_10_14_0_2_um_filter_36_16]|nr:MAG: hypothetical protein AUK12_03105 [Candidatus Levybacteria bacterium CG2_30_37_29]PIZ96950.1 MAG: hypothetical protein COX79_04030 [Candidatus Levybacteria bacterium CG_4_10_14_0_2_um_filter_36_16]
MPKKTTLLIIILAITTTVLVILAITSDQSIKPVVQKPSIAPTIAAVVKSTTLSFAPALIDASGSTPVSVDILADTSNDEISGIQVELTYDPKVITNVKIAAPLDASFFGLGKVLLSEVDPTLGRVSYFFFTNSNQKGIKGAGKIATVTFQKATTALLPAQTFISFVNKTMVTKFGVSESVLKQTTPLEITLQQPAK